MNDINYGYCECCHKETILTRVNKYFEIPCTCHSPKYFINLNLCNDCKDDYKIDPEKHFIIYVTMDTFEAILKEYHSDKYDSDLEYDLENSKCCIDEFNYVTSIRIECTYKSLEKLEKYYLASLE